MERLSICRWAIAARRGIINPKTRKVNLRRLHQFNLKVVRLVSLYIKERYLNPLRGS